MTITGTNFGSSAASHTISVGSTACGSITRDSHTQLRCSVAEGSGTGHTLSVTVTGQSTTSSGGNYNAPTISAKTSPIPTPGGSMTITGTNFGNSAASYTISVGSTACGSITRDSHTKLRCSVAAGEGTGHTLSVTVTRQSTTSANVAYSAPTISSHTNNLNTGGGSMTITGTNYGTASASVSVTVGSTACGSVSRNSHTQITCTVAQGTGASHTVTVNVEGQAVACSNCFNYNGPDVTSVVPAYSTTNAGVRPPAGGGTLTLRGTNFGHSNTNPTGSVGSTAC